MNGNDWKRACAYDEAIRDARGAVRWALVLAGCWALFRLCVWLSWGLWAVTR